MEFEFQGFAAPYAFVRNRATGKKGQLEFQHNPRLYYDFKESL